MTIKDFKKHLNLKSWIVMLNNSLEDPHQGLLFMKIILALIKTKLNRSRKILNIPIFDEYNLDLNDFNIKKHLNKDIFCFIIYEYLKFRHGELEKLEDHQQSIKLKMEEKRRKESAQAKGAHALEDENLSDHEANAADLALSETNSVSTGGLEDEEYEIESKKYKTFLDTLTTFKNNFDILDLDDKLTFVQLLIDEHLSSSDLRDYQDNFEENLKQDKRNLRESKIELKQMNLELEELEKIVAEDQKNDDGGNFYKKKTRGRGISQAVKNEKKLAAHKKELEKLLEYIELTENNIKENENNAYEILRLEPLGIDRFRRTHWLFKNENLPVIIEVPNNVNNFGQILNSQWYVVENLSDYLSKVDLENKYDEVFETEGKVRVGFDFTRGSSSLGISPP